MVRRSVFTVPSVRHLPGADSPARPEVLSCLPKKGPKEGHPDFAREPRSGRAGPAALNSLRCASLKHPAPSPGPSRPPRGAPYGRRRSKPTVSPPLLLTIGTATRKPPAPATRARHATAKDRACPGCPKTQPTSTSYIAGLAVVWTCLPVVVAPSGEGFRGRQGAGCLSGAAGAASSAPPAKTLEAREAPARAAGRGRGSRACFLGTSLHEQRSTSGRAGESAPGRLRTEGTVNTGCRTRTCHHEAGGQTKAR